MIKKIIFVLIPVLTTALWLTSCCTPCNQSSPKIEDLESATWTMIELNNNPIENSPITVHFNPNDKMLNGTALCNNFFAGYHLLTPKKGSHQNIEFLNVGATMKYCPDMELEQTFTRLLPTIKQVKIEGEHLVMINGGDSLMAVFVRAKM
ncbi:MAG: META domain-containing protein [Mucinivorans sp.]